MGLYLKHSSYMTKYISVVRFLAYLQWESLGKYYRCAVLQISSLLDSEL